MKSRVYAIFRNGFDGIWHVENVIGPANETLVGQAFFDFYYEHIAEYGEEFVVFINPVTLGQNPTDSLLLEYWATIDTDKLPRFNPQTVLRKLFPDIDDVWEYVDPDKVKFRRVWPYRRIRNTAWSGL